MDVFTYSRDKYEKHGIDKQDVINLIGKHRSGIANKIQRNYDYYAGRHAIQERKREDDSLPNHKPISNHAREIADTAAGYFMGTPIVYDYSDADKANIMDELLGKLATAHVDDADQDNALAGAIAGLSYDYTYPAEGTTELLVTPLDPRNCFVVCDDTIQQNELFGVYYDVRRDDVHNTDSYYALVCDDAEINEFILYPDGDLPAKVLSHEPHNLGYVPITEYRNNAHCIGDFEQAIGLIDAYNTLMADRVNDKEQFIDAILVVYGAILGDTSSETKQAMKDLKRDKLLEMPQGSRAEYLTRTLDEAGVETLRRALREDIYTLSNVPNFTDESFAGNSSGVAMEYKLLGLEMLTKTKERYYRKGLRKRLKMFCHYYSTLNGMEDTSDYITPTFSRALPKNLAELAQIVALLSENVSQQTLIKLLPFIDDPAQEIEKLKAQREEAEAHQFELAKAQQALLMNTPL